MGQLPEIGGEGKLKIALIAPHFDENLLGATSNSTAGQGPVRFCWGFIFFSQFCENRNLQKLPENPRVV